MDDLAGMLYDSLSAKIKPLADDVIVYPAHGAGSACGKNIGKEIFSTIGTQKKMNYALQPMRKQEFIKMVTDGLTAPPHYFSLDASLNKQGYTNIDDVLKRNTNALSVADFETQMANGAMVLDVRSADDFEKGFVLNSINIGLNGQYAPWVGALLDAITPLVLIIDEGKEAEAILRLARIGYENVNGYLQGGFNTWRNAGKSIETIKSVSAADFVANLNETDIVLDVRKPSEVESGMVKNAQNICLSNLQDQLKMLDKNKHYFIHCAGGYRSMMATSIMKQKGFKKLTNVRGGMKEIKETFIQLISPISNV